MVQFWQPKLVMKNRRKPYSNYHTCKRAFTHTRARVRAGAHTHLNPKILNVRSCLSEVTLSAVKLGHVRYSRNSGPALANFWRRARDLQEHRIVSLTVLKALEISLESQWLMPRPRRRLLRTPVNDQVLIYTPESRKANVC